MTVNAVMTLPQTEVPEGKGLGERKQKFLFEGPSDTQISCPARSCTCLPRYDNRGGVEMQMWEGSRLFSQKIN